MLILTKKLEKLGFEDNKLIQFTLDQKLWYDGVTLSHSRSGYSKTTQGQWLPWLVYPYSGNTEYTQKNGVVVTPTKHQL